MRPAHLITDRAKRYRAQNAIEQAEARCIYCGAPQAAARRLDVEHINGKEADASPENLAYACRPCNVEKGAAFARAGAGVKTRQYNPGGGAKTMGQWVEAVMSLKRQGSGNMTVAQAVEIVRATPPEKRAQFASEIWKRRRARGSYAAAVPF